MEIALVTFAFLALVVVMTPGPTVLLALSNGSRFGFAAAGYGIAGAALSDVVLIAAAGLGLGAVLSTSAVLFSVVKWIGVLYLIWLGVQMLRATKGPDLSESRVARPEGQTQPQRGTLFRKSFLVAATNPKGYLFFAAFLPQFLIPAEPLLVQYAKLALVFVVIDTVVMAAYAGLGAKAVAFLTARGTLWIDRACGGLLVLLGLVSAFLKRSEL